jgi:hypothetical protein
MPAAITIAIKKNTPMAANSVFMSIRSRFFSHEAQNIDPSELRFPTTGVPQSEQTQQSGI